MQVPTLPPWVPWWQLGMVLAALVAFAVVHRLARPRGRWGLSLRRRFVMGVPWGTLVVVGCVLAFYLFVQGGLNHWHSPVVIPFRAWSYYYPLGILTAGFAHAGASHLTGNLVGTLAFGTVAEYAWGHFPRERGATSFGSWRTNPFARVGAFVLGTLLVGVFGGAFALGPVVGFSGVVFAFAGFALVQLPITTLVVVLAGSVVNLVYNAAQRPVVPGSASPSFGGPWWADVAIQGHAIGLFAGILLGTYLVRRRREAPDPLHLFVAVVAFGVDRGLWAVYAFLGDGRYELYRAGGVIVLFVLAGLVTAAPTVSRDQLLPSIDLRNHEAAVGLTLAVLVALSVVAVPYNLLVFGAGDGLDEQDGVEMRDYTVYYAEDVTDRLVSGIDLPGLNTSVQTSGVVVVSDERNIWWTVYGERELAFAGQRTVRVGGLGWRGAVVANRTGWSTVGNGSVYRVRLLAVDSGDDPTLAYRSEARTAEPTVAGRNVTLHATRSGFDLSVTAANETLGRQPVPSVNESTSVGGLTVTNEGGSLFVERDGTRVRVANRERYR